MDALKNTLMSRLGPTVHTVPTAPSGLPAPPPSPKPTLPPAEQRYVTAQRMQAAYANNWTPNPTLIRLLGGK